MGKGKKQDSSKIAPSMYDESVIVDMAKEGFERFFSAFKSSIIPDDMKEDGDRKMEAVKSKFAFLYYSAFEDAFNQFMWKVLEDSMHEVELCLNELDELTASIKTRK